MAWLKEYADVLMLLATIIGGGFALLTWLKAERTRRTDLAYKMMKDARANSKIRYLIEYDEFRYDKKFHGSDIEPELDKLLALLDHMCYLLKSRSFWKKEFGIFRYEIIWMLSNEEVQAYLWNIYHFSKSIDAPCSFQSLIEWGLQNDLLPSDFTSKTCRAFTRQCSEDRIYLNF